MNTSNIPHSVASTELQKQFLTNADGTGVMVFTQIKRSGNVCLYRRNRIEDGKIDKIYGYEVFTTKTIKAGTKLPGNNVVEKDYETYSGKSSFGRTAWFCSSLDRAEERFEALIKGEKNIPNIMVSEQRAETLIEIVKVKNKVVKIDKSDKTWNFPNSEHFSQSDFAKENGLPERGTVWNVLNSLVESGILVKSFNTAKSGRPTSCFTKKV